MDTKPGQVIKTIANPDPEGAIHKLEVRVDKPSSESLKGAPTEEEVKQLNAQARAQEARIKSAQEHDPNSPFFQGENKG